MGARTVAPRRRLDRALLGVQVLVGIGVVAVVIGKSYGGVATIFFILLGPAMAMTLFFIYQMVSVLSDDTADNDLGVIDEERLRLEREKQLLLEGLKEFEQDSAMGKVDVADYEHLKRTAEARAIQIIKKIKDADARWMAEAERVAGVSKPPAATTATTASTASAPDPAPTAAPTDSVSATAKVAEPDVPIAAVGAAAHASLFDDRSIDVVNSNCSGCSTPNPAVGRFCVGCGRPRSDAGVHAA